MQLLNGGPARTTRSADIMKNHPCFSAQAHHRFGRIHLPVAPQCNIQCRYCIRKYDCANESRPGITSKVLTPSEALERVRVVVDRNDNISVIGIAGPGDPLANDATFETTAAISREFPDLILCVSTNGLALPDRLDELMRCGIRSITITINAATPAVAERIYSRVSFNGKKYTGKAAAERIVTNQWGGLTNAIDAGFIVKVNTVLIPGINDAEVPLIAWAAGERGADIMNIMPLIPQAEFADLPRPSRETIEKKRKDCSAHISQMSHCRQCRADACGILGEDKDMELEVLNSRIGEDYCDAVY
jgi:nitrogen fixation protein NifB